MSQVYKEGGTMSNSIIEVLNLIDNDLEVVDQFTENNQIVITVQKKCFIHICPICGYTMHSKGFYKRTINHPILQDGRTIKLLVNKRKYKCSNKACGYMVSDEFSFALPGKHNSTILPLLILKEFKNIDTTAHEVAQRLNVSDTLVYDTFINSFEFDRLPLSEIISIDEVYMNFDVKHKYPMVILDFLTGEPIDIVESRREVDTFPYFTSIPDSEKNNVKFLICDMYNQYINYTKRYFPNAIVIIDSFHVIKWLNDRLNEYIYLVKKRYQERDKKRLNERNESTNHEYKTSKQSREVYILTHYKYFLLSNKDHIEYSIEPKKDYFLNCWLDTYQKEKMFFDLDAKFQKYRDMKEIYVSFSTNWDLSPQQASNQLESIIEVYKNSNEPPFVRFASLLYRYKTNIINSFTFVDVVDANGNISKRRLSNGPIESFNNKPKSLKRAAHGVKNFAYARSRILWASRKKPKIKLKTNKKI